MISHDYLALNDDSTLMYKCSCSVPVTLKVELVSMIVYLFRSHFCCAFSCARCSLVIWLVV